jgi:sodium-dependent dicarboxylate transporter 2/3/5
MDNIKETPKSTIINAIIGVVIMLFFRFLPISLPKVTPVGMNILGIFLGTLYLWSTVDILWSSILCIFLISVSGYAPSNQALATAFGSPVVIQFFFLMILVGGLVELKITHYIARYFLTRKITNGRPWAFTFMLMIGCFLMSAFVNPFAPIFLFWPILYDIFKELNMKPGEKYPTIMLILVVIASLLGFPVPPFMSNGLALISNFANISKNAGKCIVINNASYFITAMIYGVIAILVIVLFCKFVLRPDVEPIKNLSMEKIKKNPLPTLNMKQKIISVTFIVCILAMLLPSIFTKSAFMKFLSSNVYGLVMVFVAVLCAVRIHNEPVIEMPKLMGSSFSWGTFMLIVAAIFLGNVLTNETTGITAFLSTVLSPIFKGMSVFAFSIFLLVIAVILTNLCNSLVIGMLLQPVILTYASATGVNVIPITALMIIFVLCSAAITPSASPFAALIHGNKEWLKTKDIYQYTSTFVLIELILVLLVGIPVANLFF